MKRTIEVKTIEAQVEAHSEAQRPRKLPKVIQLQQSKVQETYKKLFEYEENDLIDTAKKIGLHYRGKYSNMMRNVIKNQTEFSLNGQDDSLCTDDIRILCYVLGTMPFEEKKKLKIIDLSNNGCFLEREKDMHFFFLMFREAPSLEQVRLEGNRFSEEHKKKMIARFGENRIKF